MTTDNDPRLKGGLPLIVAIGVGVALCLWIAWPFLAVLVWSVTLAVLAVPLQRRLCALIDNHAVASALTVGVFAFVVVVPMVAVIATLVNEAVRSSGMVFASGDADIWTRIATAHPGLAPVLAQVRDLIDPVTLLDLVKERLANWSASVVQGSITGTFVAILTFYFLFFLLKDRGDALAALRRILPLTEGEFTLLSRRIVDTIHATVYGTATVAALQGGLGGLMFWMLELPAPLFWGVIMGLLAIVPFLGAFVVWAPTAVMLAASGSYGDAILLVIWGVIVVGLVDNFLYPMLVGKRLLLHPLVAFAAIFGGLLLFGTHGVILGPVTVVVLQSLLGIYRARVSGD
ncbi:MAG: AI-2E family transporter [Pseudomonadota bacterium]